MTKANLPTEIEIDAQKHREMDGIVVGAIKGAVASIPIIGSVLVGAYEGYENARLKDLVDQLAKRINKIDENKIDIISVQSDEFVDLFLRACRTRVMSRSKEKAMFIVGLLIESIHKDRDVSFSTSLKESLLFTLDRLTDDEMLFLREFSEDKYAKKSKDDVYKMEDGSKGIALDSLMSIGLLTEESTWGKHLAMSKLGSAFMGYIKVLAKMGMLSE